MVIESELHAFAPPCLVLLPAQTAHAFEFTLDVDGLVITVVQRAAVIPVRGPIASVNMLMPIFALLEREFRGGARGRAAAGMALMVALLVHVAHLSDLAAAPASASGSRRDALLSRLRERVAAHYR
ncbi:hypothetical protein C7402_108329 [Paraburkholderia unamae]|uniref:AraC-like protein n=1 Tax=Paraburkholderia unamae TaxID=219649 RepID=A0ABX5KPC5_9BURK|nr:hypothetical protein C7402_108329 [Paraburkholderia unamae]